VKPLLRAGGFPPARLLSAGSKNPEGAAHMENRKRFSK